MPLKSDAAPHTSPQATRLVDFRGFCDEHGQFSPFTFHWSCALSAQEHFFLPLFILSPSSPAVGSKYLNRVCVCNHLHQTGPGLPPKELFSTLTKLLASPEEGIPLLALAGLAKALYSKRGCLSHKPGTKKPETVQSEWEWTRGGALILTSYAVAGFPLV